MNRRKSPRRNTTINRPKIRNNNNNSSIRTTSFNVNGATTNEVVTKVARKMNVTPSSIRKNLTDYLHAINNGEHEIEEWYNCSSCGFGSIGLCLSGNCCTGSAGGGGFNIKCKRWVDTSNWFE